MDYAQTIDPSSTLLIEFDNIDKQAIGEVMYKLGFTDEVLTEGIFDLPLAKIKGWFEGLKNLAKNDKKATDPNEIAKVVKPIEPVAKRVSPIKLRQSINTVSAKGGIDTGKVKKAELNIWRALGTIGLTTSLLANPLNLVMLAIAVLVALANKRNLLDVVKDITNQIQKAVRKKSLKNATDIEKAIQIHADIFKWSLFFFWFPPMWLAAGIMALFATVYFWVGVLDASANPDASEV